MKFKADTKAFQQTLAKELRDFTENVAYSMAQDVSNEVEYQYNIAVDRFYADYSPEVYERHQEKGFLESGMSLTYYPEVSYERNHIFGGIVISSENMYTDYDYLEDPSPDPKWVLEDFLHGYHGSKLNSKKDPKPKIVGYEGFVPLDYMNEVLEKEKNQVTSYLGRAVRNSLAMTGYSLIR